MTAAYTNLVGAGWATNGAPLLPGGGAIPLSTQYWFVCNRSGANGSDGNEGTADMPFATIDFAIGKCTANAGDTIVVMQGHAETLTAASAITCDIAGINIIGLGTGADRPELTFSTAVGASVLISAANVTIKNIVGISGIDALTNPFHVQAAGCTIGTPDGPVEWQDPSSSLQAVRAILTTAAADNLTVNLKVAGITSGGTSPVNAVRLVGCNGGIINLDFYGRASTAVVEFVTTACSNIEVYGYMYNSGVTDGTKDVIDTVTGSTWFASFYDGAAGSSYAGGSAAALAADDVSTVAANLNVPTADVTTNTLERDVIGNKTDAAVTAVGTTKTITAYAKGLVTMNTVQSADSTNNAFAGDVVGNKTDASIYVPGTTKSIAAYAKGAADLQERVVAKAAAVMVNGNTIFTIAGGAIKIEALVSECVTANDGTASTLQYSVTPTVGSAATISGASASLASAAAGATVTLAGTALATAALLGANGPNLIANPGTILAPAGTITMVIGIGSTTGTWKHYMRYKPLATGVTVS